MPLDGVDRPRLGDWAVGCRSVETDDLRHADHGGARNGGGCPLGAAKR